ncbi:hypothetical protein DL766_001586 [Monosporascus sp. MC13-8B]|uniref:aminodeoxychorismate synthase n=1 Tax=Monosporascus cannonballus TaxID=155416 RepID=A0ABY0HIW6_9PEZI|nr:hypothetical protein DL763_006587 [Monosporascus cannonballus]RYO94480.1 hypothetical protein DL762_000576 [Monosporascus cannonballus]RYP37276.1 hypothetical protein DL766_001586 [Monosporascus sp. MC13-8B]
MNNRTRILFLDAYDSFSNNIASLLTTVLGADVEILPIDSPHFGDGGRQLAEALRRYDAVVCGPGPGSPGSDRDVGLMRHIWTLGDADLLPVLGICLGFQSLVLSCGGAVRKLTTGLHGMIRLIDHAADAPGPDEGNIFHGVPPFKATLYHSLHADIGQESIADEDWAASKWSPPPHLPDIVPLAWAYEDRGNCTERILMGVKHRTRPFWGLQYHPESICTESKGHQVIQNWFREAMRWNRATGRITDSTPYLAGITRTLPAHPAHIVDPSAQPHDKSRDGHQTWVESGSRLANFGVGYEYQFRVLDLPLHIEVPDIVEILQEDQRNFIVLDSASANASRIGLDVRGRYSIIALDVDDALKLQYQTGDKHITARTNCTSSPGHGPKEEAFETVNISSHSNVWELLADFWARRKLPLPEEAAPPFLGGFMGYITYEMGLEGIDVHSRDETSHRRPSRPDLCFAWITKSIVVDHLEGTLRVQILFPPSTSNSTPAADAWLDTMADELTSSPLWSDGLRADFTRRGNAASQQPTPPRTPKATGGSDARSSTRIEVPDPDRYEDKVRRCQEYIAAGDSYELCLTDRTSITRPRCPSPERGLKRAPRLPPSGGGGDGEGHDSKKASPSSSWELYRALRTRQPAPFGSYVRLGGATLLSSSPERFLEFAADGLCSMRPMKGTVRKSAAAPTLAHAERLLHVPKEEAENLMIVDLVRHDLHGVCGAGRVSVPRLLVVEEYASVFQMISVVEGRLPPPSPPPQSHPSSERGQGQRQCTGLDVLAASLPPGSMTGAPKKRSCEILREIEGRSGERGLYSGVVGYMDVAGRGDWSVTIRSLFRWDDEVVALRDRDGSDEEGDAGEEEELEVWHIGAGGAVTALSTPEGEREEMFTKLRGPLGVFEEI